MNLLKAEFLKLVYQRRTWGLVLLGTFFAVLSTAFTPWALSRLDTVVMPLSSADSVEGVYAKALGGYLLVLVLGITIMSSEFQHHTAIATFLASPKRINVLFAKLISAAIAGASMNLIATLIGMLSGTIALSFFSDVASPHASIWIDYPLAAVLIGAVLGVVGASIGSLIRNQNAAVATGLVWLSLVDRILAVIWVEIGKFLPTGLITSMMALKLNVSEKTSGISINTADYLEPLPAAGLLFAYGLVFAGIAIATTLRRDID